MSVIQPQYFAKFFTFVFLFTLVLKTRAWDSEDFQLFDLVEEVHKNKKNFYDILDVKKDASTSEIRRAYRQLSLQIHPDKNQAPDAEIKFRQLVAVYETLKDETNRERYNTILVNGLPDWRQPIFYYHRVRKLGLAELTLFLFLIATVAHYLYKWAVYFEERLTLNDMITSFRRKSERRKKRPGDEDPDHIEETLIGHIPKPMFRDLLPFQTWRLTYYLVTESPRNLKLMILQVKEYWHQKKQLVEIEEKAVVEPRVRTKPKRRQLVTSQDDDICKQTADPVTYTPMQSYTQLDSSPHKEKKGTWNKEDYILLAKAVSRFPGGTVDRWQKIAELVGRPLSETVQKSKSLKTHYITTVDPSLQGTTGNGVEVRKPEANFTDDMLTTRHSDVDPSIKPLRPILESADNQETESAAISHSSSTLYSNPWTQDEQKCFEWALAHYPKGVKERWQKISSELSAKSKEQCIERYKHIVQTLKKKRQQNPTTL